MDGSEYFETFRTFVESTLLPMQRLRSMFNIALTDPWKVEGVEVLMLVLLL
jgi:hypothetical protein